MMKMFCHTLYLNCFSLVLNDHVHTEHSEGLSRVLPQEVCWGQKEELNWSTVFFSTKCTFLPEVIFQVFKLDIVFLYCVNISFITDENFLHNEWLTLCFCLASSIRCVHFWNTWKKMSIFILHLVKRYTVGILNYYIHQ